jgi:hypothetical protein
MDQQSSEALAKAIAFAAGLRKNVGASGRRWSQWDGGADDLAAVIARIEDVRLRLQAASRAGDGAAMAGSCIADLRAILEWTTYQSASLATARAILFARKTRAFARRLGLIEARTSGLAMLAESEDALLENIQTKNGYMAELAGRFPHLDLPPPLVDLRRLAPQSLPPAAGKLALIQRLKQSAKK